MNIFAAVFMGWWHFFRGLWAERTDKKLRALDDANAEADRLLYAEDPEFAVEMGYEPPPPMMPQNLGALLANSLGPFQADQLQQMQMQQMNQAQIGYAGLVGGGLSGLFGRGYVGGSVSGLLGPSKPPTGKPE